MPGAPGMKSNDKLPGLPEPDGLSEIPGIMEGQGFSRLQEWKGNAQPAACDRQREAGLPGQAGLRGPTKPSRLLRVPGFKSGPDF